MNNINKNFQENLKRLLREHNKTQKELAQHLGISNPTVNSYVKGHNVPRMGKIDEIAKFFGVSRNELLGLDYLKFSYKLNLIDELEKISNNKSFSILRLSNYLNDEDKELIFCNMIRLVSDIDKDILDDIKEDFYQNNK